MSFLLRARLEKLNTIYIEENRFKNLWQAILQVLKTGKWYLGDSLSNPDIFEGLPKKAGIITMISALFFEYTVYSLQADHLYYKSFNSEHTQARPLLFDSDLELQEERSDLCKWYRNR